MTATFHVIAVPQRLDAAAVQALRAHLLTAPPDRVLVLQGAEPSTFCLGMDLAGALHLPAAALHTGLRAYADLLLALRTAPTPTLAVVDAPAIGGGLGLAAACDTVVAGPGARFGLPECLYGFHPAIVMAVLDERVPAQRARALALGCESVDGAAALALGLADFCAPAASLDAVVRRQVHRLGRALAPAVAALKRHGPHLQRLQQSLDAGVAATAQALAREDVRQAFMNQGAWP
ncbi:enoyl-CoA hydratase/isomerase family protein [Rubrivivax rivuli]|uniref:enoyl-CoA hydratase/isomerase family protein n=1 Tax=Rubrivivax rivuli TaxID=1862385 RepID=UPI0013E2E691|nr:enoyl-CoA hydratase/isomerase family protein [Rubrivivax rivuli]